MKNYFTLLISFIFIAFAGFYASAQEAQKPTTEVTTAADAGLVEWSKIYSVFSNPRCANCHGSNDRPQWSGTNFGTARVHAFNVQRGSDGSGFGNPGLRCTACHMVTNTDVLHGPPGAPGWHMAPAEMVWFGKSSAEICAQIKDRSRNGGRSLEEVAQHVRDDKLVAWGWAPGKGREPAPFSAPETYQAIEKWIAAGATCPSN